MAHIDALIDKVADAALRNALREQIDTMLTKQSFGLVFQPHKPETVELPYYKVRRGCKVRIRTEDSDELYRVQKIAGAKATIASLTDQPELWDVDVDGLVVVREFGEPIYPGLKSVGVVSRGGDKPPHIVINAENFHALETLLYAYEENVDAIYIDPPYNSGARDWKYNNDYVDGVDQYRHSKWLAFMERRLQLARRLLNPASSVLVVTIDEKEVHHLGMLLEQMFPDAVRQMVTIVINPLGQARRQELARVDEYAFFVFIGEAQPATVGDDLLTSETTVEKRPKVRWEWLLRGGTNSLRQDRPNLFYPIFIDPSTAQIVKVGEPLSPATPRASVKAIEGLTTVWPLSTDGTERRWRASPPYLRALLGVGHAKAGAYDAVNDRWSVLYLGKAQIERIANGQIEVVGHEPNGAVILRANVNLTGRTIAKTVWSRLSHRSGEYGSSLVKKFVAGRAFPFPKSLYAVQDTLRIMVGNKRDAVVLDFFAGSGTTAHALALLNAEDDGNRRAIMVTNNEVSDEESRRLRSEGRFPGDDEWERLGIFHHITRPRIEAALTGIAWNGVPLAGQYLDESPYSDGLEENAEFFELTYEDPDLVSRGRRFESIAPLLWLKAGGRAARIDKPAEKWAMPADACYGILFDPDQWREFVDCAISRGRSITHAFVVTDSEATFQQIVSELPAAVGTSQLYSDYLRTFEINTKVRA